MRWIRAWLIVALNKPSPSMKRCNRFALIGLFCLLLGSILACNFLESGQSVPIIPPQNGGTTQTASADAGDSIVVSTEMGAPTEIAPVPTEMPFEPLVVRAADCGYGGALKSLEALDISTVRFEFCKPEVAFLQKIAFPAFGIQPREWLEQTGGGGQGSHLLERPVGAGPYQFVSWSRGEQISLKSFESYWGKKASLPNLVFHWDMDAVQRLLELQAGSVSGIDNVLVTDFDSISADSNLTLVRRQMLSTFYIGINNTYSPLDNEKVRQALAMAIDRQKLVENFFPSGYEVAAYFAPCALVNACVGEPWYAYDPVAAKELLAEAGFPNGFEVEMIFRDVSRGYLPQPALVADEIRSQLRKNLGVIVHVQGMESQAFYEMLDAGRTPGVYLLGWGADYPDVSNFLDSHFGSTSSLQFGVKFDDIAQVLQQASGVLNPTARRPFYEAANNAIRQHVPMIPVAHGAWASPNNLAVAYQKSVQGAHASAFGLEDFSALSLASADTFTWLEEVEPPSLYCADEASLEAMRICAQITEPLYRYGRGELEPRPGLAEVCSPSEDLTIWTCTLRQGVTFHDGSALDANDVVASLWVQWDAAHPLHKGNTGAFYYWNSLWGAFLNHP